MQINFIKRVSIKSDELNLSINILNCNFNEILIKSILTHFNFVEYSKVKIDKINL